MTSRISRLFTSNASSNHRLRQSQMTTSAFEVPIFMSASSNYVQNQDVPGDEASDGTYLTEPSHRQMPQAYAASSIYSPAPVHHERSHFSDDSDDLTRSMHDLEQGIQPSSYASSETNLIRAKRRHRRRVSESSRQKIAGKKRLAMAFGVTASAMLVTCTKLSFPLSIQPLTLNRYCARCFSRSFGLDVPHSVDTVHLGTYRWLPA